MWCLQALPPRQRGPFCRHLCRAYCLHALGVGLLSSFTLRANTCEIAGMLRAPSLQNMYGMVWHGVAWYGVVWCGVVRCGVVWFGVVWFGMVWYGMVWYGREHNF